MRASAYCIILLAVGALALLVGPVVGQELITDRPDQTESAAVVPAGLWQLELGASYEWGDEDVLSLPGTLLRWGLAPRFELRLGWAGWTSLRHSAGNVEGWGDGELGGKVVLREGGESTSQVAILFASSLPFGDDEFSSDEFDPSFRFALDHDLAAGVGLGLNAGVAWETVGGSTESSWVYTAVVGFDVSSTTGLFVEVYGSEPTEGGREGELSLDGGVTWLLGPDVQLDLAAGVGLTDGAADGFVGVGISIRR